MGMETTRDLLINVVSRNVIGVYATEDEALRAVAQGLERYGVQDRTARNLTMHRQFANRPDEVMAGGEELVQRALQRFPLRQSA